MLPTALAALALAACPDGTAPCGGTAAAPALCCAGGTECARNNTGGPACVAVPMFKKIHVVYMTHLDLGFTDTTHGVCDTYWREYFKTAINTSKVLEARGGDARFRWTEFPWIVQEFLDGAAGCGSVRPTPDDVRALEEAIVEDRIIWNANAVNFLTEVLDEEMWRYSLRMKDKLNARFGKTWGTKAGKLTDTTGMSRSVIPGLAAEGVKAFHIGYNGVGGLPAVPSTFKWVHPETNTSVLAMVENSYGKEIDIPAGTITKRVHAGTGTALYYLYTVDNSGPPTAEAVEQFWAGLAKAHPEAEIVASSLDAFAAEIEKADAAGLIPVVDAELGDTWHYGAQADPIKVATFREARRLMKAEVAAGRLDVSSPLYEAYMRRLMKGPCEHNWGLSVTNYLPELRTPKNWDNAGFHAVRDSARYQALESEWGQQREWMHPLPSWSYKYGWSKAASAAARETHQPVPTLAQLQEWIPFAAKLEAALAPLIRPEPPAPEPVPLEPGQSLRCGGLHVVMGKNGGLQSLGDAAGREWSQGAGAELARVTYVTYSQDDFKTFQAEYTSSGDFQKGGMESAAPVSKQWEAAVKDATYSIGDFTCKIVARLGFDPAAAADYGAPRDVYVSYTVPGKSPGALADVTVNWANKTATRLAEAMFVSFNPLVAPTANWTLDVMGHPVAPETVAPGGTWFKHFVQSGATLHETGGRKTLFEFVDTGILAPGDVNHMLRFCPAAGWGLDTKDCRLPDLAKGGVHANLFNNLWGTAFPQWYDDDGLARFHITSQTR